MIEAEICNEALKLAQFGGFLLGLGGAIAVWCRRSPEIRESLKSLEGSSLGTSWTAFLFAASVMFFLGVGTLWERGCW